jgi:small subunit ribosomal protein S4e
LIVFIRNRLKYALNGREVQSILMQRLVKVDNKVRTDTTFPAGFMGKFSFFIGGFWGVFVIRDVSQLKL